MANKKTVKKTPVKRAVKTPVKISEMIPSENVPARIDVNPQALIAAAVQNGASLEIMDKLLDMRERLQKEAAQIAFREAMAEFQRECPVIVKSTGVDYTSKKTGARVKYQYASLDVIVAAVRDILSLHGFSYTFTTLQTEKTITAECHVHHVAGHTETTTFTLPFDDASKMNAMQTVASSLTYAKRYAFCNGFGIMTGEQDNDGMDPKRKEDEDKIELENQARLAALPENIKKGLRLLGYTRKSAWTLCNGYEWDNDRIMAALNKIADQQGEK